MNMNTRTRKREAALAEHRPGERAARPLTLEDFNLSEEDLQTIVEGSQKYLAPTSDSETVDTAPESPTSLEHGNQS
jgi:hypothetical protein